MVFGITSEVLAWVFAITSLVLLVLIIIMLRGKR